MSDPLVCCVMLTHDRPQMAERAIECFRAQTYQRKRLYVFDTGDVSHPYLGDHDDIRHRWTDMCFQGRTIGSLRNSANKDCVELFSPEIVAHWDDDDWSHPRRLEEQVDLLRMTGAQCVGYNDLLFWDTRRAQIEVHPELPAPDGGTGCLGIVKSIGEAWRYRNPNPRYATGATFLYRRELWEAHPFEDAPHEDRRWLEVPEVSHGMLGVSAMYAPRLQDTDSPRMICQMHAGGTEQIPYDAMAKGGGGVWSRVPEFDSYCAEEMKL